MKKRLLAAILCLCMVVTLLPTVAMAADTGKAIQEGVGGISGYDSANKTYDYIYYGSYDLTNDNVDNPTPIKWRVLDDQTNTGGEGLFLLSEDCLDSATDSGVYFDNTDPKSNVWQGSEAQKWCNDKDDGFYKKNLTMLEQNAVLSTTKNDASFKSSTYGIQFTKSSGILNADKIFFLSAEEAENSTYGFIDDNSRIAKYNGNAREWWLRSPDAGNTSFAGLVNNAGNVSEYFVYHFWSERPAFNLNLNSVLFSSAAVGGKSSGAAGADALTAVSATTPTEWKLTLLDNGAGSGRENFTANLNSESSNTVAAGGSVKIDYFGAKTGAKEYISAMLTDTSGKVLYYGNLAKDSASGTAQEIKIPATLPAGSYKLKIFNEELNGDKKTDYASALNTVDLTVTPPVAATFLSLTANGSDTESTTALTLTFDQDIAGLTADDITVTGATKGTLTKETGTGVYTLAISDITVFDKGAINVAISKGGYTFTPNNKSVAVRVYTPTPSQPVIQLGASGINKGDTVYDGSYTSGTSNYNVPWIALDTNGFFLSKYTLGTSQFRTSAIDLGYYGEDYLNNTSKASVLKAVMDGFYDGANKLFTAQEQGAIKENTLTKDSMHSSVTNELAARLYPLSYDDATKIGWGSDLLKARSITNQGGYASTWWLRSSFLDRLARCVDASGYDFVDIDISFGIRPAFHLNLNSVLFSSAAASGKESGTIGAAALKSVPDTTQTEWKLTLLDNGVGRENFTAVLSSASSATVAAGGSVKIDYSGAKTGAKEYISAMLTDASGQVLYYGNIANNSASGTQDITIPATLAAGSYKLKIFNEQLNGDYKTDYASALNTVDLTVTAPVAVAFQTLTANGSDMETTTAFTFTFDKDIAGLTADDITLIGATKGTLTKGSSAGIYALSLSGITVRDKKYVKVSLKKNGYTLTPSSKNVTVRVYTPPTPTPSRGGGGSDYTSSTTIITPIIPKPTPEQSNPPTIGLIQPQATVDKDGKVQTKVTEADVQGAIDKALALARQNGVENNGIAVSFDLTGLKTEFNKLPLTLSRASVDKLVTAGVRYIKIATSQLSLSFDLGALQAIQEKTNHEVTINASKADIGGFSEDVRKALSSRPAYELSIISGGTAISSFGNGRVSVILPYTPSEKEKPGNLFMLFATKDKAEYLTKSSYNSSLKAVIAETNHFSVYGIGYKETKNNQFADITNHWAKDAILFVADRGLLLGTEDGTFSPDTAMSRGMFVTVLGRLAGEDVSSYKTSKFTDVKPGAYYLPYIEWANKNGIVKGTSETIFAPDESITREQMAVIMASYAKTIGFEVPKTHTEIIFADSGKISGYAKEAVKQMQMAGVLSGKTGNIFDPQGTATRAEVSTVLNRFVELVIDEGTAHG